SNHVRCLRRAVRVRSRVLQHEAPRPPAEPPDDPLEPDEIDRPGRVIDHQVFERAFAFEIAVVDVLDTGVGELRPALGLAIWLLVPALALKRGIRMLGHEDALLSSSSCPHRTAQSCQYLSGLPARLLASDHACQPPALDLAPAPD